MWMFCLSSGSSQTSIGGGVWCCHSLWKSPDEAWVMVGVMSVVLVGDVGVLCWWVMWECCVGG